MNSKAYAEVYQIIQYLPEAEYRRIPLEQIRFLKNNMDTTIGKICTITTDIEQIKLSLEAQTIFISLFYNYIANEEQKIKLKNFLLNEEKKNLEESCNRMFDNKTISNSVIKTENTELTIIPKKSIFSKIKYIIDNFINKFKF